MSSPEAPRRRLRGAALALGLLLGLLASLILLSPGNSNAFIYFQF